MKSFSILVFLLSFEMALAKPKIAFTMRLKESNFKFTKQIKDAFLFLNQDKYDIDFYNHYGDSSSIATVAKEIRSKKYDLVIGGETSKIAIILSKFLPDIPIISPTATSKRVLLESKNTYLVSSLDTVISRKIGQFINDKLLENKKIVIFHNKSFPNTDQINLEILEELKKNKSSVEKLTVLEYYDGNPIDEKFLNQVIINGADYFISLSMESEIRLIHNILVRNKIKPIYIGGDGWGTNNTIKNTFQKIDSGFKAIKYTYWDEDRCNDPHLQKICYNFKKNKNIDVNEFHAIGFDTFMLLSRGWDFKKKKPKNKKLKNIFTGKSFFMNNQRYPEKDVYFFKFTEGSRKLFKL